MGKCAFLFTGQGAQYAGMGKDLYENHYVFKSIVDEASEHLKIDLLDVLCDENKLSKTYNAQIAIFILSYGLYNIIKASKNPDCLAGFSLGEITSLAVSEILSFTDTLDLIKIRGEVMQAACDHTPGSMYSVIGAEDALVGEICESVSNSKTKKAGYVVPANYNCPGQVVISGEINAVGEAVKIFAEKKIRTVKLNVAGAFHSKLMQYKQDKLIEFLKTLNFSLPKIKIDLYSNLTGKKFDFDAKTNIKEFMIDYIPKQMSNPVRFREELENIENIENDGCDLFIEIGAGKVLSGFVKRTCKNPNTVSVYVQDNATLDMALDILNSKK